MYYTSSRTRLQTMVEAIGTTIQCEDDVVDDDDDDDEEDTTDIEVMLMEDSRGDFTRVMKMFSQKKKKKKSEAGSKEEDDEEEDDDDRSEERGRGVRASVCSRKNYFVTFIPVIQWLLGRKEEAEAGARRVLRKYPLSLVARANVFYVLWRKGARAEAVDVLGPLVNFRSKRPELYQQVLYEGVVFVVGSHTAPRCVCVLF